MKDHYGKLAITPFQYGMANKLDPMQFSVVKYVTRFRDKNGVEDLRKAIDCLEQLIAHEAQPAEPEKAPSPIPSNSTELDAQAKHVMSMEMLAGSTKADPHADLRKTWKPGQRWQIRRSDDDAWEEMINGVGQSCDPLWLGRHQYRRHPDDGKAEPEQMGPLAARGLYKLGESWQYKGAEEGDSPSEWTDNPPGDFGGFGFVYRRKP